MTPQKAPDYSFDVRDRFTRSKLALENTQPDLCAVLLRHTTPKTQTYSKKGQKTRSVLAKWLIERHGIADLMCSIGSRGLNRPLNMFKHECVHRYDIVTQLS